MAKYKPAKPKTKAPPQVKPGAPCVVIVIGGMILVMILLYEVLKHAS